MLRVGRLSVFTEAFALMREAAGPLVAISFCIDVVGAIANAAILAIAGRLLGLLAVGTTWSEAAPWLVAAGLAAAVDQVAGSIHDDLVQLGAEHVESHAVTNVLEAASVVPFASFDSPEFYDRLRRAQESGSEHAWSIVQSTMSLGRSLLDMIAVIAVLAFVAPLLIPIALAAYIPLWIVARLNNDDEYNFSWEETESDRRRSYLESLLSDRQSAKEVRLFAMQPGLLSSYRALWATRLQHLHGVIRRAALRSAIAFLITSLTMTAALGVVVWLTIRRDLDLEQAGIGVLAVRQLSGGVTRTSADMEAVHGSRQFFGDYQDFRTEALALVEPPDDTPVATSISHVRIEDVSFCYPGSSRAALHLVNLEVGVGQLTAVVGANGSGKSTLMHLLAGLYAPSQGQILWDGVDTASLSSGARSDAVSVLFQDFTQFHFTVADNLTLGGHDQERLALALDMAEADFVHDLPAGIDTQLGKDFEAGTELSIGQWQRLALARALYRDAPLLLLDEPASALDPAAELALIRRLKSRSEHRVTVLVSHRFASVRNADHIIVLDEGRVIEQGTHQQLVDAAGAYCALFEAQTGLHIPPDGSTLGP